MTSALRWLRRTGDLPDIRQTEVAECGLACLAMISTFHGRHVDLAALRRAHPVTLRGTTLRTLIEVAARIGLVARPIRLEPDQLCNVRTPAILHWSMTHFVVLRRVGRGRVTVHDPAAGVRRMTLAEASRHFTGVALELSAGADYTPDRTRKLTLRELLGSLPGMASSLGQLLLLSAILQLYVLISPFLLQLTMDEVIANGDADLLAVLGCGFALAALINAAAAVLRTRILCHLQATIGFRLGSGLFRHLLRLPLIYFERRHIGDLVSRFYAADPIRTLISEGLITVVVDGTMAALTFAMMLVYAPQLSLLVLAALAVYVVIRLASYHPLRSRSLDLVLARARESTTFIETVRAIQGIRLFGREAERGAVWMNRYAEVVQADTSVSGLKQGFTAATDLVFALTNVAVICWATRLALRGEMSAGMIFAFYLYKQQFVDKVTRLIEKAVEFRMLDLHLERLADVVRTEPEPSQPCHSVGRPALQGTIEVRDLSFRYAASEPTVLHNVSFSVDAGEYVAIVGPSGCGKSTLLKVLLGLLPISAGEIRYDGLPLATLGTSALHAGVGVVMQDDQLLSGSIADNIAFFAETLDPRLMEECARIAGVHGEIARMPMGYDSLIGDTGLSLSGGQKQRVLLARALYKQPRILMMDEGTSHLDVAMERQVNEAIKGLGLTRIIIAHRPETIASAERKIRLGGPAVTIDGRMALQDN